MAERQEDSPGSYPVNHSVTGQSGLTAKEARTSHQPGAAQRTLAGQDAEESQLGRQEPDADGARGLTDSVETKEAIQQSPRTRKRRGRAGTGKAGLNATKDAPDRKYVKVFDDYSDISPTKE
jgi:hypothetical protein